MDEQGSHFRKLRNIYIYSEDPKTTLPSLVKEPSEVSEYVCGSNPEPIVRSCVDVEAIPYAALRQEIMKDIVAINRAYGRQETAFIVACPVSMGLVTDPGADGAVLSYRTGNLPVVVLLESENVAFVVSAADRSINYNDKLLDERLFSYVQVARELNRCAGQNEAILSTKAEERKQRISRIEAVRLDAKIRAVEPSVKAGPFATGWDKNANGDPWGCLYDYEAEGQLAFSWVALMQDRMTDSQTKQVDPARLTYGVIETSFDEACQHHRALGRYKRSPLTEERVGFAQRVITKLWGHGDRFAEIMQTNPPMRAPATRARFCPVPSRFCF